jgi:hypothetical protein
MARPRRLLNGPAQAAAILERFAHPAPQPSAISYATVRDFCDSADQLSQITPSDGDLKNVQRPWAVKAILAHIPPPARLLEIGGGEPIVSGFLAELGYEVTLVDPYDGFGNGPTDYERYIENYPHVRILRGYFQPNMTGLDPASFDAIFSISVLEHISENALPKCFDAIDRFLRPSGASIHCFDFIIQGVGEEHAMGNARQILAEQQRISGRNDFPSFDALLEQLRSDTETFFLSPQGHHHWRGGQTYENFPFRRVVSIQTIAQRQPADVPAA